MVEGPVDPGHRAEAAWLNRWRLTADGDQFTTASSTLIPARTAAGEAVMIKVSHSPEEQRGGALLAAWNGRGAARVLESLDDAVLIERATGARSLVELVSSGRDDEATRILCDAATTLHAESSAVFANGFDGVVELDLWFRELFSRADELRPFHRIAADAAERLLADPRDRTALHGDVHHGNVLDFGERGWLAIDPKGLVGERSYDFCTMLANPGPAVALSPGRFERQFRVVTDAAGLDPARHAEWLVAWCGLSSAWFTIADDPVLAASMVELGEMAARLR